MNAGPHRVRALLLLAALLGLPFASPAGAERLPLQNFTVRDGLPSDTINCLVRDRLGLMWICTAEGLAYYDGFSFRAFTEADGVPHRRVTRLLHARDGTYWVGTNNGLAWFRPSGRSPGQPRFTHLPAPMPSHWSPDVNIATNVAALYEDRSGRIWCGTISAGLFVVENDKGRPTLRHVEIGLPIDTWVNGLAESDDGTFWVATTRGLWSRAAGEASAFVRRHVTAPERMDMDILSLLIRGQQIFAGTRDAGLHLVDSQAPHGGVAVVRSWQTPGVQGGDRVLSLIQTRDGHLWYGGAGGAREVVPTVEGADALRIWGASAGLGSSNVSAIAEDGWGNLWVGTDGAGVFRWRRGGFTQYTVDDGLAGDQIKDLFVAQGALHVVTADVRGLVLNRLDGGRFRAAASPFTLDWFHNRMNQLAAYDRQGNWWLATPEGFMRSTARSHERVPEEPMRRYGRKEGLWTEEGYKVFVDSAGDVWMGSSGGFHNLSRWRKSTETIERHQVKTVPSGSKSSVRLQSGLICRSPGWRGVGRIGQRRSGPVRRESMGAFRRGRWCARGPGLYDAARRSRASLDRHR